MTKFTIVKIDNGEWIHYRCKNTLIKAIWGKNDNDVDVMEITSIDSNIIVNDTMSPIDYSKNPHFLSLKLNELIRNYTVPAMKYNWRTLEMIDSETRFGMWISMDKIDFKSLGGQRTKMRKRKDGKYEILITPGLKYKLLKDKK